MIFLSLVPEKKLTVEDVKYVLSTHYQGTPYDPYTHREICQSAANTVWLVLTAMTLWL